jgi:cytochrome c biogenesis protein CcdA
MPPMIRLIGIVISIGLADSLNPSTIAVALYLATGERARERVTQFTIGVFGVYFLGGAAIALGPGELLLSLVPHPDHTVRHVIELVAGAAMLVAAALLWIQRDKLAQRDPPGVDPKGRASWVLGASITVIELPTAFPYFAAIAAIVGSGAGPIRQLFYLLLFNVAFVLPLLVIIGVLTFGGDQTDRLILRVRNFLERRWPHVLAAVLLAAGVIVIVLGLIGLTHSHKRLRSLGHRITKSVTP